jgi:EAL domain-containing protein (putative c-di-GMP-specific phosphodiesterase class I)
LISDTFVITFNLNRNTLERLIVTDLIRLVETHDIPPFLVEFDISDQDVTHPHVIRTLSQLKDHGFRVSLDVFRTDAITLGALSHVPLHTIKLDRSFLPSGIDQAPQDDIYRTITRLSRVFSQRLMAKGIENRHQLEWIRQLGIDSFQGYYITPPLNDFRIRGFLNKYHDTPLV